MLSQRMGELGKGPTFGSMPPVEDARRLEDEHMSKHLTGVRHKLLSNPLYVRRLGPTSDNLFDGQEQCYRPKWIL